MSDGKKIDPSTLAGLGKVTGKAKSSANTQGKNAPTPGKSSTKTKSKATTKATTKVKKGSKSRTGKATKSSTGRPVSGKSNQSKPKPPPGAKNTSSGRLARMRVYAAHRVSGLTQAQACKEIGVTTQTGISYEQDEQWPALHNEALAHFLRSTVFDHLGPIIRKAMQTTMSLMDDTNPSNRASALKSVLDQMLPLAEKLGVVFLQPEPEPEPKTTGHTVSISDLSDDEVSKVLGGLLGQGQASQQAPGRGIRSAPSTAATPTSKRN